MKKVLSVQSAPGRHWVGDGFPVQSLFSYQTHGQEMSPFLLLDYAGPREFPPAERPRGVGQHPHRGFETVTIVYQGEVEHRDSHGGGGKIGPGDVQWMTAGGGLLHEEFHSRDFTSRGGTFEVVQLWVNLPSRHKMAEPKYQAIVKNDIPVVDLAGDAGTARLIAGEYGGSRGPARTYTPMNVWDLRLNPGKRFELEVPENWTTAVVVLRGTVQVSDSDVLRDAQFALLETSGTRFSLEANNDAVVLVLGGEPIIEPIAGHGPFVMNTREEIQQAIRDFSTGRFGQMPA
ncbi:MAG TPA: pirin family protein [Woeseiaceae bacterium]|nr:pirin family protein [Woeseiaceae bacterium]